MDTPATSSDLRDPVCGMTVTPEVAEAAGLITEHDGHSYYFCGRGCRLEFLDDPSRFFDPDYIPQM